MNDKLLQVLIDTLSIEELEEIIRKKKGIEEEQKDISEMEDFRVGFEKWFKAKLYPPKDLNTI